MALDYGGGQFEGIFEDSPEDGEFLLFSGGRGAVGGKIYKHVSPIDITEYTETSLTPQLKATITLDVKSDTWIPLGWKLTGEIKNSVGGGSQAFAECVNTDVGDYPDTSAYRAIITTNSTTYTSVSDWLTDDAVFTPESGTSTTFKVYLESSVGGTSYLKNIQIEFFYLTNVVELSVGDGFGSWS